MNNYMNNYKPDRSTSVLKVPDKIPRKVNDVLAVLTVDMLDVGHA